MFRFNQHKPVTWEVLLLRYAFNLPNCIVPPSTSLYRKHNNSQLPWQLYIQRGTLVLLRSEWQPQGTVQWLPRVFPRQCLPEWVTAAESNLWQHINNNNQAKEPGPEACTHGPSNRWHCRTTNILWRTVTLMLAHQNPVIQRTQPKDILYHYSLRLLIWSMALIFLDLICVKLYYGEGFETALNHHVGLNRLNLQKKYSNQVLTNRSKMRGQPVSSGNTSFVFYSCSMFLLPSVLCCEDLQQVCLHVLS